MIDHFLGSRDHVCNGICLIKNVDNDKLNSVYSFDVHRWQHDSSSFRHLFYGLL